MPGILALVPMRRAEQHEPKAEPKIVSANPAVRTRLHEVASWSVAVSNKPNHLKNDFLKKQSAYELKPNCFHQARRGTK
jgi:hypothetical protein